MTDRPATSIRVNQKQASKFLHPAGASRALADCTDIHARWHLAMFHSRDSSNSQVACREP